jgi:hypothetical protein
MNCITDATRDKNPRWLTVIQANVLSLEEQIIDATTEEGQKQLKDLEEAAAAEKKFADDPE